jgi:hypothetical protein
MMCLALIIFSPFYATYQRFFMKSRYGNEGMEMKAGSFPETRVNENGCLHLQQVWIEAIYAGPLS